MLIQCLKRGDTKFSSTEIPQSTLKNGNVYWYPRKNCTLYSVIMSKLVEITCAIQNNTKSLE